MDMRNIELLNSIDSIESSILESEISVCLSLCEHYGKISTFMEYSNVDTSSFMPIFQESTLYTEALVPIEKSDDSESDEEETSSSGEDKHEFLIIRLIKAIGTLFKKIGNAIVVQIRGIFRIVKNVFTHEEVIKAFKHRKKNKDKYKDLSMDGVPDMDETDTERAKLEPYEAKTAGDIPSSSDDDEDDVEETETLQIYNVIKIWDWFNAFSNVWDEVMKGATNIKNDINATMKSIKNAKNIYNNKSYQVYEVLEGSSIEILDQVNSPIEKAPEKIKGKSRLQILEELANGCKSIGDKITKYAGDLSKSHIRKDIKKDPTKLKAFKDFVGGMNTASTGFEAVVTQTMVELKKLINNINVPETAAA